MRVFEITSMTFESNICKCYVKVEDDENEDDAEYKAIKIDQGWGDGIYKILSCEEVFHIDPNELE